MPTTPRHQQQQATPDMLFMPNKRHLFTIAVFILLGISAATASPIIAAEAGSPAPEETRLNTMIFRKGLKDRGLTEILALHLQVYPPTNSTTVKLLMRDAKLAEFADTQHSTDERLTAITEANQILEEIIQDKPDDPRRFDWLFTLAHSLVYDEAEPFFTNVLYRGGSREDRRRVLAATDRAITTLTKLQRQLGSEFQRIDQLGIDEFEQIEKTGYVDAIDAIEPKADYLLLWALFYDSLARNEQDPIRIRQLNQLLAKLESNSLLLETSHITSRVQVQALLLAGMANRLLNDHIAARQFLGQALEVAARLTDLDERERVRWAVTLGHLERVRNERDAGQFEQSLRDLQDFKNEEIKNSANEFGLMLVAELAQRSVYLADAQAAKKIGRTDLAARHRKAAWQVLQQLAEAHPDRRDEIYATRYETFDKNVDHTLLDPFDQCALIAGLLFDSSQTNKDSAAILARITRIGENFLSQQKSETTALVPEVLYNIAAAEFRRGRSVKSVKRFLKIAQDFPGYTHALKAATFATEICTDLNEDPELRAHPEFSALYLSALQTLVQQFPNSVAATYWRFYYAQLLENTKQFDKAASQYALVDRSHQYFDEASFRHLRSLAEATMAIAESDTGQTIDVRQRANDLFELQRSFLSQTTNKLSKSSDTKRKAHLRSFIGRAKLLAAEVQVLPTIGRASQSLESLRDFEKDYPEERSIAGRVWRVRLLAFEQLGRLDEAAKAIPHYITADPEGAGPMLQTIYNALSAESEKLLSSADPNGAMTKAQVALIVAQQINQWAAIYAEDIKDADGKSLTIQLAQANLRAGQYARAEELFQPLVTEINQTSTPSDTQIDPQVNYGYADAVFQQNKWGIALPYFNQLATKMKPDQPLRWRALLRDLQCRTSLGQNAADVLKVIQQQKFLFPEMGGSSLSEQFDKLMRENQRRLDGNP